MHIVHRGKNHGVVFKNKYKPGPGLPLHVLAELKPVFAKLSKYMFGSDEEIIAEYQSLDKIWFFACFLHKHLQSPLLSESYLN